MLVTSAAVIGALLSCFFWTYEIFQVPGGLLVDRMGRTPYPMPWPFSSSHWPPLLPGLSRGLADFLTARLVLGMAESVGPLASLSYIGRNFSAKEQALPTAIYLAGVTLGPAAGTLLGAHLLVSVGWGLLFVATGFRSADIRMQSPASSAHHERKHILTAPAYSCLHVL